MKKIIFDCDNTFGVKACDVDDGLALLYLLGDESTDLIGITSTYGNSDIETVFSNTKTMLAEIGRSDIPVLKGCANANETQSEAVEFLLDAVNQNPGDISILATGSLTNLHCAYLKDNSFFEKISEIVLMGGLTEPLLINGRSMGELNFACDPQAAFCVLTNARNLAVATGNNCLAAYFSRAGYNRRLKQSEIPAARYIYEKTAYWYDYMADHFELDGFFNWDVVAAAYLMDRRLFEENETIISPTVESLENGFLIGGGKSISVKLPKIKEPDMFEESVYSAYLNVAMGSGA